jgi:hypothetical protein
MSNHNQLSIQCIRGQSKDASFTLPNAEIHRDDDSVFPVLYGGFMGLRCIRGFTEFFRGKVTDSVEDGPSLIRGTQKHLTPLLQRPLCWLNLSCKTLCQRTSVQAIDSDEPANTTIASVFYFLVDQGLKSRCVKSEHLFSSFSNGLFTLDLSYGILQKWSKIFTPYRVAKLIVKVNGFS